MRLEATPSDDRLWHLILAISNKVEVLAMLERPDEAVELHKDLVRRYGEDVPKAFADAAARNEHDEAATAHYLEMARELKVAVSGGSDYHADEGHGPGGPGSVALPRDEFDRRRRRVISTRRLVLEPSPVLELHPRKPAFSLHRFHLAHHFFRAATPPPPANYNWRTVANFSGNNPTFSVLQSIWQRGSEFFFRRIRF